MTIDENENKEEINKLLHNAANIKISITPTTTSPIQKITNHAMNTVEKFELHQQPIPDLIPMVDLNSNHNHNVKSQSPSLSIHDPDDEQKDIELNEVDETSISIQP